MCFEPLLDQRREMASQKVDGGHDGVGGASERGCDEAEGGVGDEEMV